MKIKVTLVVLFCIVLFTGCKKEKEKALTVTVETISTINTAAMFQIILSKETDYTDYSNVGLLISSSNTDPDMSNEASIRGFVTGYANQKLPSLMIRPCLTGLQKNTAYYVKAYVKDGGTTYYSNTITVQTGNDLTNLNDANITYSYSVPFGGSYPVIGYSNLSASFSNYQEDENKFLLYKFSGQVKFDGVLSENVTDGYILQSEYNHDYTVSSTVSDAELIEYKWRPNHYTAPCTLSQGAVISVEFAVDGVWDSQVSNITFDKTSSPTGTIISPLSGTSSTKIYIVNGAFDNLDYSCIKSVTVGGLSVSVNKEYINGSYLYYFYPPFDLSTGSGKRVYIYMPCSDYYVSEFTKL